MKIELPKSPELTEEQKTEKIIERDKLVTFVHNMSYLQIKAVKQYKSWGLNKTEATKAVYKDYLKEKETGKKVAPTRPVPKEPVNLEDFLPGKPNRHQRRMLAKSKSRSKRMAGK